MPFPEAPKVKYAINPLDLVVCQIRFPSVLKIDAEIPSQFHELIKSSFLEYREKIEFQHDITITHNEKLPFDAQNIIKNSQTLKNHEFYNDPDVWKVNLTRNFIALSTSKYIDWQDFYSRLNPVLAALKTTYGVNNYTRVGLRYIDVFNRTNLGLADCPWHELINPEFVGVPASQLSGHVRGFENVTDLALADGKSSVRIAAKYVMHKHTNEICFAIDSDFYRIEMNDFSALDGSLAYLHERASRLLRWTISEKLHNAMRPETKP